MKASIDVASRVSPQLSTFIEKLVNDPDREDAPTLKDVRAELARKARTADVKMHPQDKTSVLAEIDSIIEEYGEEMLAVDFVVVKASEALSRIIETAMTDVTLPKNPTLGVVRQAMADGLTARLMGDGAIDADEDGSLLAEMDALVQRFGADALAENFIRFE